MAREIVYSEDGIINARVKQKVDTLSNWESNDMIILDGEQAFVRTADGVPVNFKIGEGDKPFRDLPFWLDSGSPFKLRLTDTDYVEVTGGNTIVTHPGLVGFDDYPVMTTQMNVIFRDEDLTYNSTNGTVTISDFELQAGELLILCPPSMKWAETTGSGSALAALVARVDELERMAAPFVVNELTGESPARVWWTRPLAEIPNGWAVDADWAGRVPVGYNASDTDFNVMGKTGGVKDVKLTSNQQGETEFQFQSDHSTGSSSVRQVSGIRAKPRAASSWSFQYESAGAGYKVWSGSQYVRPGEATESHTNMPPYRVGCWIKYVGA